MMFWQKNLKGSSDRKEDCNNIIDTAAGYPVIGLPGKDRGVHHGNERRTAWKD